MLDLVKAFAGCPSSDVHILTLVDSILLAYAFGDSVVLLDARTFTLVRALAFFEVFPALRAATEQVKCVSIEPSMKLIAASLGSRIAIWCLSDVQKDVWRVHSSIMTSDDHPVTAIDCKSGLLGVASSSSLAVYTLGLEDNLPVWTRKWVIPARSCSVVRLSPSLMHLSIIYEDDNTVRVFSTASGSLMQSLRHSRPVKDFIWRFSEKSGRDDLILYTVTIDDTLRIFLPVLDTPHYLQLHASVDLYSDHSEDSDAIEHIYANQHSNIFWLHKDTISSCLDTILHSIEKADDDGGYHRLKDMNDDGWDFFFRVSTDNSLVMRAIAHIDRRPPTLLKHFTLLQSRPSLFASSPDHLHILRTPGHSTMIVVTSPPLLTYEMDLRRFMQGGDEGMTLLAQGPGTAEANSSKIARLIRTPEGRGLAILREKTIEAWQLRPQDNDLQCVNRFPRADLVSILDYGRLLVVYINEDDSHRITLYESSRSTHCATNDVPPLSMLVCLPYGDSNTLIGLTASQSIVQIQIVSRIRQGSQDFELIVLPPVQLPHSKPLVLVTAIDPMAWSKQKRYHDKRSHDILMSLSEDGDLVFWLLDESAGPNQWVRTGQVRTGRTGYRLACCSSAKKSALVYPSIRGDELSIWDSKESEFASGLEHRVVFEEETVRDLDWTATPDSQSILAVGFTQHVLILCQQRMTYFNEESGWGTLLRIDVGQMLTYPISDSIWLAGGTFVIAAGHLLLRYGEQRPLRGAKEEDGLFERVAWLNGPLPDYHPQMILQCLLWGKLDLVKETVVRLFTHLKQTLRNSEQFETKWENLPVDRFLESVHGSSSRTVLVSQNPAVFNDTADVDDLDLPATFSGPLVQYVITRLENASFGHLSKNEKAHLIVLLQATYEVEAQRRALDSNGLRYLISLRSFYILNAMATSNSDNNVPYRSISQPAMQSSRRERLRYRDMVWAFHSESQEILLSACDTSCGGKMKWVDAKALGIFLWLNSTDSMKAQMEGIARNQYMAGENRDPTACSLFYFALGKVRLVHGLWRQAAWHKEQPMMLKFLSNDFSQPRWRTAALKNAFALLSKQRFEYAAAFFILGGGLKDAVNICVRYLDDPQLAIALARVVEEGEDRPILKAILTDVMIPVAFEKGNRWLASWAFWLLNRRNLAVRILVSPLEDVLTTLSIPVKRIGDQNYDDPSLALLFSQLKMKSLQTATGVTEISEATEFSFVLQISRIFCRMGCHALALFLVKTWSFDRPSLTRKSVSESRDRLTQLPGKFNRPVFGHKRGSSILIDMDIPSDPSTRAASPTSALVEQDTETSTESGRPKAASGLGNLMKSAKHDISVPEFDMNAFF